MVEELTRPLRIIFVEDSRDDYDLILRNLQKEGLKLGEVLRVEDGTAFRNALSSKTWDLILSDFKLPMFSGLDALQIRMESGLDIPFILVSGSIGEEKAVQIMKMGANDYLLKDNTKRLAAAIIREVREKEKRNSSHLFELELKAKNEYLGRLKRFFSPKMAEMLFTNPHEDPFKWHRAYVTVVFIDLRGFTSFTEITEPEDVISILQEYYKEVGFVVQEYGGTLGHVAGDGIMVFFNDPIKMENPDKTAIQMTLELRERLLKLGEMWHKKDFNLGFGAGIASGHATVGGIGGEGCWDYSIIGKATNLAARLCAEAKDGEILVSSRIMFSIDKEFELGEIGPMRLKGFHEEILVYNILREKKAFAVAESA